MKGEFIPIETILNINDDSILWYAIDGFNGYELSTTGIIRSMKHYKKYPFGIYIKPKSISKYNVIYELSDNNNKRVSINKDNIITRVRNNPYKYHAGYPRHTIMTDISSRNNGVFVKRNQEPTKNPILNQEWVPYWTKL